MIKVNLLGVERPKRTRISLAGPSRVVGIGAIAVVLVGGMGYVWWSMSSRMSVLQQQKAQRAQELAALKDTVKEVENFESNKKSYEEKIGIIEQLRKNQIGPIRLLDELSQSLPDRVWLTSLNEQSGKVELEGKAVTNAEIVDFINNLKASRHIREILLIESRQVTESGVPVYNFKLKCTLVV
ncbi:MAG: PilN domain-containing protein [candidate division Zixibacteria bacterium]|nr:PilN domain-containing protein [candidate division Zixibacteria bacterium]